MNVALVSQVQTCQNLLTSLLQNRENTTKEQMEKLFIFSLIWSVGALLNNKDRKAFNGITFVFSYLSFYALQ